MNELNNEDIANKFFNIKILLNDIYSLSKPCDDSAAHLRCVNNRAFDGIKYIVACENEVPLDKDISHEIM